MKDNTKQISENIRFKIPLIEAVAAVCIFVIAVACVAKVFVKADELQKEAVEISRSSIVLQDRAELLHALERESAGVYDSRMGRLVIGQEERELYYEELDSSFSTVGSEGKYILRVSGNLENGEGSDLVKFRLMIENSEGKCISTLDTSVIINH